jgi:hypothetical protein
MNTKEILTEIDNLKNKEAKLTKIIKDAVYKYLDEKIGLVSVNSDASDDIIGKGVAEEWHWYWNIGDIITIVYCVFINKWGDYSDDEKEINVDFSVIDKYIEM